MKDFSNFLSLASIILLLGYIVYNESGRAPYQVATRMSDEAVAEPQFVYEDSPLPAVSFDLPPEVKFAGESVPLDIPDVRERLDKELQSNIYLHSNTIFLIKRASRWLPQMKEILRANDIP